MISGSGGSGAVFFSGCGLRCVFCQNIDISATQKGKPCDSNVLSDMFLRLQSRGVHNINLVSPSAHIKTIKQAIIDSKGKGLTIPIVYNTSGYDSLEGLSELNGLVDIYLPDIKYVSPQISKEYSSAADYFFHASRAVEKMFEQVGELKLDGNGIAYRGVLIRHLVLPGNLANTRLVLEYIRNTFPKSTYISLMRQYTPMGSELKPPLDRKLTQREYDRSVDYCLSLGFENLLIQGKEAVGRGYIPEFYDDLLTKY